MISLIVAGDFHPQNRVKKYIENGDYAKVWNNLPAVLAESDYSLVNLESPVVKQVASPIKKTGPNLKSSYNSVEALQYVGFKCVTLANNHFYDYGEEGVNETLGICESLQIDTVGGGRSIIDATKLLYKEIKGKIFVFVNVCEHEWSISSKQSGGSAPLDPISNYYQIQEARSRADYIIVIVHGGTEYYNLPTPRMKQTYRFFIDCGADVVVNHHQHCYSGYEQYKGKYVFYGLGNFCFDKGERKSDFWNEGFMLKLLFNDMIDFELIPYVQCAEKPEVCFEIDKDRFTQSIAKLNGVIADDELLELAFNNLVKDREKSMLFALEPYRNKYVDFLRCRGLFPLLLSKSWCELILALFRCEAHRDIMLNVLNRKVK